MRKFWSTSAFLITFSILGLVKPANVWAQVAKFDATQDSSVNEEAKDFNMNSQPNLLVGVDQQGPANNQAYSFIKFSPLSLPAGTAISKASLVMYLVSSTGLPTAELMISRVTSDWQESTLTWNNKPTSADGTPVSVNSTVGTKKFDITYIVRNWQNNPNQNFGIKIAPVITNQAHMRGFNNRSGRNLYIEVTYTNPADFTPPTISNVKVTPSKTTAQIHWATNELLKEASVEYGPTAGLGKKAFAVSTQSTALQVNLSGLKSSTLYSYKIKSIDFANNQMTKTGTFTTLGPADNPAASSIQFTTDQKTLSDLLTIAKTTITNLKATEITYKSALITWDTTLATDSRVEYGKSQRALDQQKSSTPLATKHSVRIDGLAANTRYYYLVKSKAPTVREASFPPGDPQIFVTKQPTAAEAAADAQAGRDAGRQIAEDLGNLDFSFGMGGSRPSGTTQPPQSGAGTTAASAGTSLTIYDPRVTDITTNSAIARWVTNKTATTQVFYWRPGFYANSVGTTAHTTNHVITLPNLAPNTQYNYLLRSITNWGETIVSPEANFLTRSASNPSTSALSIESLAISNITSTGATFNWTTNKPADELLVLTDTVTSNTISRNDPTYQTQHIQTVNNLSPGTVYSVKLTVKTQTGETRTTPGEFKTQDSFASSDSSTGETLPSDDGQALLDNQDQLPGGDEMPPDVGDFVDPDQIRETTTEEPLIENQESATDTPESIPGSLSISKDSVLGGIISRIPAISNLLKANNSASKPDLAKIALIILVIILALILLSKKGTDKPAPKADTIPLKVNQPEISEKVKPTPETITENKKPKKKNWLVIIILLILGITLVQSLGFLINPAVLLAPFMSKFLDQKLPTAQSDASFSYVEGTGPGLSVKKLGQNQWPQGSQGGLFEIGPAGEFKNLAKLSLKLEKPIPGFTLGYWYPENKKWVRIPTIRRSGSTYEGYLTHASLVTGSTVQVSQSSIENNQSDGVAGSGDFEFRDPNLRRDWQQIKTYLATLQDRYDRGIGGNSTDSTWNLIESILSRMSSVVINHCRGQPSLEDRVEFLQVMALSQLYGFDTVFQKFDTAWNTCIPLSKEVQTSSYIIKQTDKIPYSYNFTGIGKATGESTVISDGVVIKTGKEFGWQGDWQVVQNTSSSSQIFNQLNLGGLTSSGVNSTAKTKDLTMLLFSLEGVAAGSEFPLYIVRIGDYEEDISGPTQDLIFALNNKVFGTGRIKPDSKTISSKGGLQVKAKLIESYGKDGALISYGQGGMDSIGGQQGEAVKQIGQMAAGNPALKQLYDEMMTQSSGEIKLKIIPSGL